MRLPPSEWPRPTWRACRTNSPNRTGTSRSRATRSNWKRGCLGLWSLLRSSSVERRSRTMPLLIDLKDQLEKLPKKKQLKNLTGGMKRYGELVAEAAASLKRVLDGARLAQ